MPRLNWETRLLIPDGRGIPTYITPTLRMPFVKCRIYYQGDPDTGILGPALVDSGAVGLLMPKRYADTWHIDISTLEQSDSAGAGSAFNIYKCNGFTVVIMGIAGEIEVDGAFTDNRYPPFPLLGIQTLFQHYRVTIDALAAAIDLEPY